MHEPAAFIEALTEARSRGERCAMAQLVAVAGSSYRRIGARILIRESGRTRGLLSGGCLEADVAVHAESVLQSGIPKCVHYDLRDTAAGIWGLGLGCDGVVDVYIESLETKAARRSVDFLSRVLHERRSAVLRTVFDSQQPDRLPIGCRIGVYDGKVQRLDSDEPVPREWRNPAELSGNRSGETELAGVSVRYLEEQIDPPQRLIVCGAGEDAEPLVTAAVSLGWHVVVLDRRDERLGQDSFAGADRLIGDPHRSLRPLKPDARDAVVTLTHLYEEDRAILEQLYGRPLMYFGLLGPRARSARLVDEVKQAQSVKTGADWKSIFAPVGIDLGAETPAEIALAIIAEIQAVRTGRPAGFLRDREESLHAESLP